MDKRYQVFVSSTYADLQQERQKVIQTLMEMDCIPAGMELFPAVDEEQWTFIKRVIDDCDYYVLIIGGRYGSLTSEGISYTEQEYDYAISAGLKVLAFVHECPDEIPVGKSDIDANLRQKLNAFRAKVSEGRLVKFWRNTPELPGLVALSLSKTMKLYPAIGWVRASTVGNPELLTDLNNLRKENQSLRDTVATLESRVAPEQKQNLASLGETVRIKLEVSLAYDLRRKEEEQVEVTWADMFARIAPSLMEHPNDSSVRHELGASLYRKCHPRSGNTARVDTDDFETIRVQFCALDLVRVSYNQTTKGGRALFWSLTPRGQKLMTQLRTVKTASANDAIASQKNGKDQAEMRVVEGQEANSEAVTE